MTDLKEISVFNYFDYREYLSHVFCTLKKDENFSFRSFQEEIGISGSAFFFRIMDGSRNFTLKYVSKFSRKIGLNSEEERFLKLLIEFCDEKNIDIRDVKLKELLKIRSSHENYALQDAKLSFFEKWYYPVIRDLLPILPKQTKLSDVGRMLYPTLKTSQVESAVNYLEENDFLEKQIDGGWIAKDPMLFTPPRVKSTYLRNYHQKNLELNQDAYEMFDIDDRSLSSVTCSMSQETFEKVRHEIEAFREKIMSMAREDENPDRVCHVGFQLMPRAKRKDERRSSIDTKLKGETSNQSDCEGGKVRDSKVDKKTLRGSK